MRPSTRRRISFVVMLATIVLFLWRCTGAFDRDADLAPVSVFGPWLGAEAEAFADVLHDFTSDTGIEVQYTGSSDFDGDLRQRIIGGLGLPDIAIVPQPALFAELIVLGVVEPLSDETIDAVVENFSFTRDQLLVAEGNAYLAPYRNNVKSLVWYRPDVFEDRGWDIPDTLDALGEFADELAETDIAPWCFTMEAGAVTGWAATDWVEDLVLRRGGPEAYDEWVAGERPFDNEVIRDAFVEFDDLVLQSGHVAGGTQRVLSTRVEEASTPLFDDPPGCAMYKQGTFATNWFPDDVDIGPDGDVDFFVLPGVDSDETAPLLVGGDGAIRFNDRDEVARLMTFLVSPEGADAWIDRGGFLSTRRAVDLDQFDDTDRRFAGLLLEGREVRFDASDSFLTAVREVLLEELTRFVAETNYLDPTDELDDLVEAVDATSAELADSPLGGSP